MAVDIKIGKRFEGDVLLLLDGGIALSLRDSGFNLISNTNVHTAEPKDRKAFNYAAEEGEIVREAVLGKGAVNALGDIVLGQMKQPFDYELEFAMWTNNMNSDDAKELNIAERIQILLRGGEVSNGDKFDGLENISNFTLVNTTAGVMMECYYKGVEVTNYGRRKYDNIKDYVTIKLTFRVAKPSTCSLTIGQQYLDEILVEYKKYYLEPSNNEIKKYPLLPVIGEKFESDIWLVFDRYILSLRKSGLHLIDQTNVISLNRKERESNSYIERDGEETGIINTNYESFEYSLEFMMFSNNMNEAKDNTNGIHIPHLIDMLLNGGLMDDVSSFGGLERLREVTLFNFYSGQKIVGYYKSIEETTDDRQKYDNIKDYKTFRLTFKVFEPSKCSFTIDNNDMENLNDLAVKLRYLKQDL